MIINCFSHSQSVPVSQCQSSSILWLWSSAISYDDLQYPTLWTLDFVPTTLDFVPHHQQILTLSYFLSSLISYWLIVEYRTGDIANEYWECRLWALIATPLQIGVDPPTIVATSALRKQKTGSRVSHHSFPLSSHGRKVAEHSLLRKGAEQQPWATLLPRSIMTMTLLQLWGCNSHHPFLTSTSVLFIIILAGFLLAATTPITPILAATTTTSPTYIPYLLSWLVPYHIKSELLLPQRFAYHS